MPSSSRIAFSSVIWPRSPTRLVTVGIIARNHILSSLRTRRRHRIVIAPSRTRTTLSGPNATQEVLNVPSTPESPPARRPGRPCRGMYPTGRDDRALADRRDDGGEPSRERRNDGEPARERRDDGGVRFAGAVTHRPDLAQIP